MQDADYLDDDRATTDPSVDLESDEWCYDCGGKVEWYWMHNDLWASAVPPEDRHEWICVRCMGKRLGRPLTPDDLNDFFKQKAVLIERLSIPYGYCYCTCGEKTKLAKQTIRRYGHIKGEPLRYIFNHHTRKTGPQYLVDPETGCWVWQWHIGPKGYGSMRPYGAKRMHPAHIVYYERAKGPVPAGKQLDHLCHDPDECVGGVECLHRRCVNPDHLEPVTPRENSYRGQTRPGSKQKPGRKPKRKPTHCKHGHEYTPENIIIRPNGWWRCRACQTAAMMSYYQRRKAAGHNPTALHSEPTNERPGGRHSG